MDGWVVCTREILNVAVFVLHRLGMTELSTNFLSTVWMVDYV